MQSTSDSTEQNKPTMADIVAKKNQESSKASENIVVVSAKDVPTSKPSKNEEKKEKQLKEKKNVEGSSKKEKLSPKNSEGIIVN
jgi:hypothetical protein